MDTLEKCPYCGADANVEQSLVSCSDKECWLYRIRIPINEWQYRPLESVLRARVAELEATVLNNILLKRIAELEEKIDDYRNFYPDLPE